MYELNYIKIYGEKSNKPKLYFMKKLKANKIRAMLATIQF